MLSAFEVIEFEEKFLTWLSRTASLLANTPSRLLHLLPKSRVLKKRKVRRFFCHLWPTAKKDNGEPDTKESQPLGSTTIVKNSVV